MQMLTKTTVDGSEDWLLAAKTDGAALLIDKEIGWTSFDVVARLRTILRIKEIGHAGTLDPLATGLLIVCCGKATKTIESYQDQEKVYETVVRLGATTATYDSEQPEQNVQDVDHLQPEAIAAAVQSFVGEIDQLPPMYSARKVGGKRLYELARKGQEVERSTRRVVIHSIEVLSIELPMIHLRLRCSKGTYVRSLAHDIGQVLGCGAYMYSLRRTMIGDYHVDQALSITDIRNLFPPSEAAQEQQNPVQIQSDSAPAEASASDESETSLDVEQH